MDFKGYRLKVRGDGIRHAFNRHSDESKERLQGQRAVTASDFRMISEMATKPDTITRSQGKHASVLSVTITKIHEGDRVTATFDASKTWRTLTLKGMHVKRGV